MDSLKGCIIIALLVPILCQEPESDLICPGGYCVSKSLCVNNTYIDDPKNLQENSIVTLRIDEQDECNDYFLVCCKTDQPPPITTDFPFDEDIIGLDSSVPLCGLVNENGLAFEFVHNDTIAQYGEYPWVVYIVTAEKQSSTDGNGFVCGGTLIHPRFVVTTAHNTEGKSNLIARFGEWDSGTTNEPYPHQEVRVTEVIMHPEYVRNPITNDIALLMLAGKGVEYTRHIKPICLPQPTDDFVGRRCISNGWGTVKGVYASIMKKVSLPVLPKKECIRMLRYAGLGPRFNLREGFMCAGGEADVDMCKGDGGSPLACESESGSFVLAGIVSWGIGCGGDSLPGVYVEVSNYHSWITEYLIENDIGNLFTQ